MPAGTPLKLAPNGSEISAPELLLSVQKPFKSGVPPKAENRFTLELSEDSHKSIEPSVPALGFALTITKTIALEVAHSGEVPGTVYVN